MKHKIKNIKSIELFTGAGGLALGMTKAGCDHVAMIEYNRDSCDTIRQNMTTATFFNPSLKVYQEDAKKFDYTFFENMIDAVIGGPPCQPFSMGGIARGCEDSRDMFPEAVRAVRILKPRFFIFENVKGLLRQSFASYFNYIILQLSYPLITKKVNEKWTEHLSRLEQFHTRAGESELSYRVVYRLLDAADYGIPQHRHRVFIVGFRSDLGVEWNFPTPTHSLDRLLWEQWITGEYWDSHKIASKNRPDVSPRFVTRVNTMKNFFSEFCPKGKRYQTVRDALFGLPDPRETFHNVINHEFRDGAKPYPRKKDCLIGVEVHVPIFKNRAGEDP